MRRLQALLLLIAAASATACLPFGLQRSKARVAEIETTSRYGGSSTTVRTEIDYLSDGRVDEMTRTASGDFLDRWELSYDRNNRVEELAIISDDNTVIVELTYTGELLTEASARDPDDDQELRWDIGYFNGDRRFVESVVLTLDAPNGFTEIASKYAYDDSSRIKEINTSALSESEGGDTSESSNDTELRYDTDTGKLERVTTTTEVPYYPAPESDWCWDGGYYTDGWCDSGCPQPDPDCGGGGPAPVAPSQGEPEILRSTSLYSVKYDDDGRLEEMDGPEGETITVDYDSENRIDEVETRNDGNSTITEYSYDEGVVNGHTFSPALPSGKFFDLAGASFGTVEYENPIQLIEGSFFGG